MYRVLLIITPSRGAPPSSKYASIVGMFDAVDAAQKQDTCMCSRGLFFILICSYNNYYDGKTKYKCIRKNN